MRCSRPLDQQRLNFRLQPHLVIGTSLITCAENASCGERTDFGEGADCVERAENAECANSVTHSYTHYVGKLRQPHELVHLNTQSPLGIRLTVVNGRLRVFPDCRTVHGL